MRNDRLCYYWKERDDRLWLDLINYEQQLDI